MCDKKLWARKYYLVHRETYLARAKKWNRANPEKKREYDQNYRRKNREKRLEYAKNYYRKNREKKLEYYKNYRRKNPEKVRAYEQSEARKGKMYFHHIEWRRKWEPTIEQLAHRL